MQDHQQGRRPPRWRMALRRRRPRKICVFDLGGGTFDVLPGVGSGRGSVFRIISTSGDTLPRRRRFPAACWWTTAPDENKHDSSVDLRKDPRAGCRGSRRGCEEGQASALNPLEATDINLPNATAGASGPKRLAGFFSSAKRSSNGDPSYDSFCRTGTAGDEGRPAGYGENRRSRARRQFDPHPQERCRGNRQVRCSARNHTGVVNPDEVVAVGGDADPRRRARRRGETFCFWT